MKKILLITLFAGAPFLVNAQCLVQVTTTPATCFGNCDGTAAAFPMGGTPPYTFMWSPGGQTTQTIGGLCAGTYTLIVTDAVGCMATAIATISQPSQIVVMTTTIPASCSTCCDGTAIGTASGGTLPYVYNWIPTGGPSPTATNLCPGTYSFCVTDANGCTSCSIATVSFTTGIQDVVEIGNFSVFPNPASGIVTIDETFANPTNTEISICNLLGEIIFVKKSGTITQLHETINIAELPNGIYFITVKTPVGNSIQRFVKQ